MNEKNKKRKIGVLMGGCSSEREISLKSGNAVLRAFQRAGQSVVPLDIDTTEEEKIIERLSSEKIELAFICLHGTFGEDGKIQDILEKNAVPFTGSGAEASRIAMDKRMAQALFVDHGLPVPPYRSWTKEESPSPCRVWELMGRRPVVVKPAAEGSSFGVSIVSKEEEMAAAVELAFQYGKDILVDEYIAGRELTVGVLVNRALPVVEIRPKKGFFDFSAKYQKGETQYLVPAEISDNVTARLHEIALEAFRAVGARDFARIDFRLSEDGKPFLLELNSIPGFTETSLLPMAAKQEGIGFEDLCMRIAACGFEREEKDICAVSRERETGRE